MIRDRGTASRRIASVGVAAALLILAAYGAMFMQHAVAAVRFPYQMDYGEGVEIYMVSRLLTGEAMYTDIRQPPYHVGVYPPLYTLTITPIEALAGLGYGVGRAVNVLLTLVIAWLLGRMAYEDSQKVWVGVATGLFWLATYPVYAWAVLMRVDMLAIALATLGLYLFWRGYIRRGKEPYIYAAMLLFVAAAYARQTSVSGAAACLVYLAVTRRWKQFANALVLYAGLGLAILAALQASTGGQFYQHLVTYNLPVWSLARWYAAVKRFSIVYPFAILASLFTFALALLGRAPLLPALYLGFAGLSTATIGALGAYINHLLEADAALCLAFGVFLGRVSATRRAFGPLLASAVLLGQTAMMIHLPYTREGEALPPWGPIRQAIGPWLRPNRGVYLWTPTDADVRAANELDERIRQTPGLILSEDGAFTATHGRPMWIQFLDFALLHRFGFWDQTPFLEEIRNRKFALVLLKFDTATDVLSYRSVVTPEMLDALRANYVLERQIWLYYVYRPRPNHTHGSGRPAVD
jgi:hypothetical protein